MDLVIHSTHQWNLSSPRDGPLKTKFNTFYEQLNVARKEFRLLSLLPGNPSDPVICELEVWCCDKSKCPQYEALSYVWGGPPGPNTIVVRNQHVHVTSNLESALRHLRYQDHARVLWIDALCINQDDLRERNHQVRQMRFIYQFASRVIVWLGPADSKADKKNVDHIFRFASDETLHWTLPSPEGAFGPHDQYIGAGPLLFVFFNKPWWKRIWTVQEAAVASELTYICGHTLIPSEIMMKVAKSCLRHMGKCCNPFAGGLWSLDLETRMKKIMELEDLRDVGRRPDFLDVFQMNRYRDATNPRDMIYGLMGLTEGMDENIIRYEATVQATYEQSTLEIINKTGKLDVFSQILGYPDWTEDAYHILQDRWGSGVEKLPSWVPDWSRKYKHTYLSAVSVRQKRQKLFRAEKDTRANVRYIAPGRLLVEGLDLLQIKQLGREKPPMAQHVAIWSSWREMARVDNDPDRHYVAGGTILNAFWRTLCLDCSLDDAKDPLRRATTDDGLVHDEWWWNCIVEQNAESFEEKGQLMNPAACCSRFQKTANDLCTDRCFFMSSSGYIGLVPSTTMIGDRVCVLTGGRTPYILRPSHKKTVEDVSDSPEYTFVGDAYVHGLMDGEAFDMVEKGSLRMQNLILK